MQGTFGEAWDWAALQTSSALACKSGAGCVKLCQTCQSARVLTAQVLNTSMAQQHGDTKLLSARGLLTCKDPSSAESRSPCPDSMKLPLRAIGILMGTDAPLTAAKHH